MKGFNIPFRQIPYQKFQPITRTPQGVQPDLDMEIRNLLAKGAITQIPLSKDGYYSRIFLVPKKGGGMRPVIDLSSLNNFVDNSNEPSIAEVSSFHLERQSISIQSPSIWPERSASSVYRTIKTNRSIFKKTRHSSYPVFRRYANYRLLCSRDNAVYSNSDEPACLSRVHYSQREINNNSNSNHHLSGIHHQFYHKTNKPAPRESNKNLDTLPPNFDSRDVSLRSLAQLLGLLESHRPAIWKAPLHFRHLQAQLIQDLQKHNHQYNVCAPLTRASKTELTWWLIVRSLSGKNWQDLYKADKGSISFPATPKSN